MPKEQPRASVPTLAPLAVPVQGIYSALQGLTGAQLVAGVTDYPSPPSFTLSSLPLPPHHLIFPAPSPAKRRPGRAESAAPMRSCPTPGAQAVRGCEKSVVATVASLRYAFHGCLARRAADRSQGQTELEGKRSWGFFSGKPPAVSHQPPPRPVRCGSLGAVSCRGFPLAAAQGEARRALGCAALPTAGHGGAWRGRTRSSPHSLPGAKPPCAPGSAA